MGYPDDAMPDASTWWTGHIAATLINAMIVAPLNAIRARILGHGPVASGIVTITPSAANTATTLTVPFPSGRFGTAPVVTVSARTGVTTTATGQDLWVTAETTTQFTLGIVRGNTTPVSVAWQAMQTS